MELLTKSWYTTQLRTIQQLCSEPSEARPALFSPATAGPRDLVLEVAVESAELAPLPGEVENVISTSPFVRLVLDREALGATATATNLRKPVWNERFLVMPRGSVLARFEVCETCNSFLSVRCSCILASETALQTVQTTGQVSIDMPLYHNFHEVGVLHLHLRMWDGLPLEEPFWWLQHSRNPQSLVPGGSPWQSSNRGTAVVL
mmetsp:Transcript_31755/g.62406  ORF Transcript_31755/g.62406 Transcript_31755/m.62406 type:complete len:204 (+) Transcript_31755:48-659(+)